MDINGRGIKETNILEKFREMDYPFLLKKIDIFVQNLSKNEKVSTEPPLLDLELPFPGSAPDR